MNPGRARDIWFIRFGFIVALLGCVGKYFFDKKTGVVAEGRFIKEARKLGIQGRAALGWRQRQKGVSGFCGMGMF